MSDYHEKIEDLSSQTKNFTRALHSLKEEIEAVDWYNQRVDASDDPELAAIMAHNRDEEIEHACMALEWLRRNMPAWDENLRMFLFSTGDITEVEENMEAGQDGGVPGEGNTDLGIGGKRK